MLLYMALHLTVSYTVYTDFPPFFREDQCLVKGV